MIMADQLNIKKGICKVQAFAQVFAQLSAYGRYFVTMLITNCIR